jgi:hypothetical protein
MEDKSHVNGAKIQVMDGPRTSPMQEPNLPAEVLVKIFSSLSFISLLQVAKVCWYWNQLAQDKSVLYSPRLLREICRLVDVSPYSSRKAEFNFKTVVLLYLRNGYFNHVQYFFHVCFVSFLPSIFDDHLRVVCRMDDAGGQSLVVWKLSANSIRRPEKRLQDFEGQRVMEADGRLTRSKRNIKRHKGNLYSKRRRGQGFTSANPILIDDNDVSSRNNCENKSDDNEVYMNQQHEKCNVEKNFTQNVINKEDGEMEGRQSDRLRANTNTSNHFKLEERQGINQREAIIVEEWRKIWQGDKGTIVERECGPRGQTASVGEIRRVGSEDEVEIEKEVKNNSVVLLQVARGRGKKTVCVLEGDVILVKKFQNLRKLAYYIYVVERQKYDGLQVFSSSFQIGGSGNDNLRQTKRGKCNWVKNSYINYRNNSLNHDEENSHLVLDTNKWNDLLEREKSNFLIELKVDTKRYSKLVCESAWSQEQLLGGASDTDCCFSLEQKEAQLRRKLEADFQQLVNLFDGLTEVIYLE